MTTICSKCGSVLAADADILFCPQCGTPTSNYSKADISSNEPTAMGTSIQSPSLTSITDYGSNPYGAPQQNSSNSLNPYDASIPTPPPPPPALPPQPLRPSRRPKLRVLISIVLLVLIIVGVSVGGLVKLLAKNPAAGGATAEKNPYAPFTGTMALNDTLVDNSKGYSWDEGTISDGSFCQFMGAAYYVNQSNTQAVHSCFAQNTNFSNFTYELKMTILKGGCGGLIFMADGLNAKYFVFDVCQDGTFSLFYFSGYGQSGTYVRTPLNSSAINTGLDQSNLIAIVANRSNFDLYVNSQKIDSVVDETYSHGEIGVIADPLSKYPTEVVYSNAKVWTMP